MPVARRPEGAAVAADADTGTAAAAAKVTGAAEPRPLRADARRNRDRVLEAAREVFAAEGLAVPLDDIARRAGVGAGTVYRHFPTKEALFEAVIVDRLEYLAGEAELAERTAADAGTDASAVAAAFFGFLALMVADASTKKDLADALAGSGVDLRAVTLHASGRLRGHLDGLLARAQAVGAVRAEVDIEDLHAVVFGALAAEQRRGDSGRPGRIAELICDGLRPLT